jgi:isoquinoline 1-oxidoreductase beta subunit
MLGITDVAIVSTGVAVRGETLGQCIDAVRGLDVSWGPGTETASRRHGAAGTAQRRAADDRAEGADPDQDDRCEVHVPLRQQLPAREEPRGRRRPAGSAEIWSCLKSPIVAQQTIAERLKLPQHAVTVHVVQGGGSFGRHLFFDAAVGAAEISQKMGKPV